MSLPPHLATTQLHSPVATTIPFSSKNIPCEFLADILVNLLNLHLKPLSTITSCIAEVRKLKITSPRLHCNQSFWMILVSSKQRYDIWFCNWANWGERARGIHFAGVDHSTGCRIHQCNTRFSISQRQLSDCSGGDSFYKQPQLLDSIETYQVISVFSALVLLCVLWKWLLKV